MEPIGHVSLDQQEEYEAWEKKRKEQEAQELIMEQTIHDKRMADGEDAEKSYQVEDEELVDGL